MKLVVPIAGVLGVAVIVTALVVAQPSAEETLAVPVASAAPVNESGTLLKEVVRSYREAPALTDSMNRIFVSF